MRVFKLKLAGNCVFLFFVCASNVMADTDIRVEDDWLRKMVNSARHTNYSGTFVYQSGSNLETSRITHLSDGKDEHERLEGLSGERSEVVRRNGQIWCYLGEAKAVVAQRDAARTFPALLPEQIPLLRENYSITYGEEDRVAGFKTRSIIFKPRDRMRYTHMMWADNDSGLLLKAVVLDEHEHIIEQYVFTQIKINGDFDRKWIVQPHTHPKDRAVFPKEMAPARSSHWDAVESGWRVYFLPEGFKKISEVNRHFNEERLQITHIAYSDGLAGVSVFVEKQSSQSTMKPGLHDMGVSQLFIKLMDGNVLTVIGEVPPRTLLQIAESVRQGGNK